MVSVFLDRGTNAEQFAATVTIKRGDIVAIAVSKLELIRTAFGVRSCGATNFVVLDKSEVDQLRSGSLLMLNR